jgi:PTS system nitrogen regulatory IIA component
MKIKEFLSPSDVLIDFRARDKLGLLRDISSRAASALKLPADAVAHEIVKRDELGSTGIGRGVCIPHARLRAVNKPHGLLTRLRYPIDFDAVDGQPVDIVFLLLLPASSQLDQLNALAAAARKLRETALLHRLRAATTAAEMFEVITSG